MPKESFDNVIRFPVEAVPKFGLERVKKHRGSQKNKMERLGQLDLFSQHSGRVVALPPRFGPFEEALLLDERGDEKAASAYWNAIEANDCVADAYCNLGVMESRNSRITEAFECFTSALKHDPRHFESHYNVGNMYFEAGDLRPARLHYELAAELEPDFPNVYFNLGLVDALSEDFNSAVDALSRYKELAPDAESGKVDELLISLRRSITAEDPS